MHVYTSSFENPPAASFFMFIFWSNFTTSSFLFFAISFLSIPGLFPNYSICIISSCFILLNFLKENKGNPHSDTEELHIFVKYVFFSWLVFKHPILFLHIWKPNRIRFNTGSVSRYFLYYKERTLNFQRPYGGEYGARTRDLLTASQTRSQLRQFPLCHFPLREIFYYAKGQKSIKIYILSRPGECISAFSTGIRALEL